MVEFQWDASGVSIRATADACDIGCGHEENQKHHDEESRCPQDEKGYRLNVIRHSSNHPINAASNSPHQTRHNASKLSSVVSCQILCI
jgi:hypothetical protein